MSTKRRDEVSVGFGFRGDPAETIAEDLDTAKVVMRVQDGDSESFGILYTRYFDRVYSYMRVAFKDLHEGEDMTQQAFTQAFAKMSSYSPRTGTPFRAWLFTVVRNLAVSELRKSGRLELMDPVELQAQREAIAMATEDEYSLGLDALNWTSDSDLVIFIERLPLAQRQVLALRYIHDLTNPEIAKVMDRSADEVKVLHYRACIFLRARLDAIGRSPGEGERLPAQIRFKQNEVARHRRFMLHK